MITFNKKVAKELAEHAAQVAFEYPQFNECYEIIDDWMRCPTPDGKRLPFDGDELQYAANIALKHKSLGYQGAIDAVEKELTR
jgi:hypothetical protein